MIGKLLFFDLLFEVFGLLLEFDFLLLAFVLELFLFKFPFYYYRPCVKRMGFFIADNYIFDSPQGLSI